MINGVSLQEAAAVDGNVSTETRAKWERPRWVAVIGILALLIRIPASTHLGRGSGHMMTASQGLRL